MYEFFMALPAILAVGVFVIFHFLKNRKEGDAVSLRIVDKLRQDIPERFEKNYRGQNKVKLFVM